MSRGAPGEARGGAAMSFIEIGAALGMPTTTVHSIYTGAIRKIKRRPDLMAKLAECRREYEAMRQRRMNGISDVS